MKNIKHFLAAFFFLGFAATTGFAQTEAKLEQLVSKTKAMAAEANAGTALNKKANPNPTSIIELEYLSGTYDTISRTVYTYNTNGDVLQETTSYYDNINGNFELASRGLYTYNNNNVLTQYLMQSWDDSVWVDEMRQSVTYNAQGDMTQLLIEVWAGAQWFAYFGMRLNYTYDTNNNPTEIVIQQRTQLGAWEDMQRQIVSYGTNNEPVDIITQARGTTGWENETRMTNMTWHNWGGIMEQQFTFAEIKAWDGSQWVNAGRQTNAYNNDDQPLSSLTEDWDVNTYVNSGRNTWTYDNFGNLEISIEEEYNMAASAWDTIAGERSTYTYNADNSIAIEILAEYNMGWEVYWKKLYTYPATSGISKKTSQVALEIYPNPASDVLNLKLDAQRFIVTITDLNGRNVLQAQNDRTIDVSNLKSGIYIVNVTGEKGNATIKFVKN